MLGRIRQRPSPALVISVIALVLAVGGGSFALAALNRHDKTVVKKIARKVADKEINKKAPSLTVDHSKSADSATNASQLNGRPAGDYLLAHSRGVALAGAEIEGNGSVITWFNTLGGAPAVTASGGGYGITFPGLGDASQTVLQATLGTNNLGGQITADWGTPVAGQTDVEVLTFNASGMLAPRSFYVVVYGASSGG